MKITDEMIEAGAKVTRRFAKSVQESDPEGAWSDCYGSERQQWRNVAEVALEAALAVAPEPVDHSELIAEADKAYEDVFNVAQRERDLIRRLADALEEVTK